MSVTNIEKAYEYRAKEIELVQPELIIELEFDIKSQEYVYSSIISFRDWSEKD